MNGTIMKHMQADIAGDLEQINRYTRRPFTAQEVYTFSVVLCDNEIDRDFERFSIEALHVLGRLFLGKTGIFFFVVKAGNQAARIYDTAVEAAEDKMTSCGEVYTRLVAKAYLPRCDKNADLIMEIESGMKKEVSVGCAVAEHICSVCGTDRALTPCGHEKGKVYAKNGKQEVCCVILNRPTDAYEWSFVAVPAQREAGVIKMFATVKGEVTMEQIMEKLRQAQDGVFLSGEEAAQILRYLEQTAEYAACGKAYREEVSRNVVKLCSLAQPQISPEVMKRVTRSMGLEDLKVFEKAFRAKAEEVVPLRPQLAAVQTKENSASGVNQEFKI